MKRVALSIFVLCLCAGAQVISVGPIGQPPIDAFQCIVMVPGQTALCFAKDGVHVSLAGAPFGPPLPQGVKGDKGDKGDPGTGGVDGKTGPQGIQGIPGNDAVFPTKVHMVCPPIPNGSIPKGWAGDCTVTKIP